MCRFCAVLFADNHQKYASSTDIPLYHKIEVDSDIAKDIIEEIHALNNKINHLQIDNQSLTLHNSSYKEELIKTKNEYHQQLQQAIAFANKQTDMKIKQELELSKYLGNETLINNLQNECLQKTKEMKNIKEKLHKYETEISDLRDELNYSRSVIALYKYPKTSSLHNMASYRSNIKTKHQINGSKGLDNFDNEFLHKINTRSIKTCTVNPEQYNRSNTSSSNRKYRPRSKSGLPLSR